MTPPSGLHRHGTRAGQGGCDCCSGCVALHGMRAMIEPRLCVTLYH
jgi:hypothetical protein